MSIWPREKTMTYEDWETLKQRKATAEALRLKAQEGAPEGRMVSGHFVAPSWTQHLAHGLKNYMAGRDVRKADKDMQEWQAGKSDTMKRVADILRGGTGMREGGMDGGVAPMAIDPGASPAPGAVPPKMPQAMPLPQEGELPGAMPQPALQQGASMGGSLEDIIPVLMSHPGTTDMAFELLMQRAKMGDEMAQQLLLERMKQQVKPPSVQKYREGDEDVSVLMDAQGNVVREIGRGPAWNPNQGPSVSVSYGSPIVGMGPDGQPMYYQPSNRGGLEPTGVTPPPEKPSAASAKNAELARTKIPTLDTLESALNRLEELSAELGALESGPVAGRGPAFSDTAAQYEATLGLVRPLINQITRTPGEGSVSDFEQRLKELQLPGRTAVAAGRQESLQNLRALIDSIRGAYQSVMPQEDTVDFGDLP